MNTTEVKMSIKKKVKEDVYGLFDKGEFKEGSQILQGLSFRLQNDDETKLKRLVLRNLSFAFYKIDDIYMARKYARMIKDIADNDKVYQEKNKEEYSDILNLYSEFCPDEISFKDKLNINKLNRRLYYDNINHIDKYFMAESNICILTNNYDDIESLLEQIHNMRKQIIFEDKEKDMHMKYRLKEATVLILQDLEIASPIIYRRIIESINSLTKSNSTIVI